MYEQFRQTRNIRRSVWPLLVLLLFLFLGNGEWGGGSYAGTIPTGQIRVTKETKPANSVVDFAFQASGNSLSRIFSLKNGQWKFLNDVPVGSGYQLRETVPDGWMLESATCSDGSPITNIKLSENEVIFCRFVNVQLGQIIVKKITNPLTDVTTNFDFTSNVADGGTREQTSFTLHNNQIKVLSHIVPGSGYSIVESTKAGWDLSSAVCSDGSPPTNIDVEPGETVTCTFTNTQNGKLIVRKLTDPSPDLTNSQFSFTTDGTLNPNSFTLGGGDARSFDNLQARSGYRVRELPKEQWQLSSASCSNGSDIGNIRIDPGATTTCTFRNTGTLVDLRLTKSDGGITAEPGDTIVYTLQYENKGTKNAEQVVVTEQVPANTSFVGQTGPNGWSCPANAPAGTSCQYTVGNLGGNAAGQIAFQVKVVDTVPNGVTTIENSARIGYSAQVTVAEAHTQTPLKAFVGLNLNKDDEGVTANPGGTILYTLAYENAGNQAVAGVLITETVPVNTTFAGPTALWDCAVGAPAGTRCVYTVGQLAAGQSGSTTFSVKVNTTLPAKVTAIENQAQIGNNQISGSVGTEQTELQAAPDLALTLSDDDATVAPGGVVRYHLNFTNVGAQGATNVVITKDIPNFTTFHAALSSNGWVCTAERCTYAVGMLASGAGGSIDFALALGRPLPADISSILNTAQIRDDGTNGEDAVMANNSTSETTPIVDTGRVVVTKRAMLAVDANNDEKVSPGDTLEYIVTLQNQRGIGVQNVRFSDTIDASLYLLEGTTTTQGAITAGTSAGDSQLQVNVGTMAGDSTVTIRFRAAVRTPLPANIKSISNQGLVETQEVPLIRTDDPTTPELNDPTVTLVNAEPKLEMTLADFLFVDSNGDSLVSVGDTLIYRLQLRNRGNGGSPSLQIQVPIAENAALVQNSIATTAGVIREGADPADEIIRIDLGEIAGGAQVNITFQVHILGKPGFTAVQHQAVAYAAGTAGAANVISDDPDTNENEDQTTSLLDQEIVTVRYLYLPLISR